MRLSLVSALACVLYFPTALSVAIPQALYTEAPSHRIAAEALDVTPPTVVHEIANTHDIINARVDLSGTDSNADTDPPGKYFHEAHFHHHYDGRFAKSEVPYAERRETLIALIQSYLATMNEIGAETWIMHGSLLGWWWNKKIMPWDTDLDVMVSEQSADHLAKYYNMTVHHYKHEGWNIGRDYMLEMNPYYTNTSIYDGLNKIDGRWVDMASGLFIDITVLHQDLEAQAAGHVGALFCKDNHTFTMDSIFPLRESVFENTPCLIPYSYTEILLEEYGPDSLTKKDFEMHHFDQEVMDWIPIPSKEEIPAPEPGYEPQPTEPTYVLTPPSTKPPNTTPPPPSLPAPAGFGSSVSGVA
ncbi:Protein MNN4 [Elsinoe australis]|uniref:Protein MNN4 n=1 Tax=Elsinoe australis TaxID=40998 RepID=A0A2P8AJ21_9PEZI|nr:Protein MNN4 [Elsinoe australis]